MADARQIAIIVAHSHGFHTEHMAKYWHRTPRLILYSVKQCRQKQEVDKRFAQKIERIQARSDQEP